MGIAGFFRWLQNDYGECIANVPPEVIEAALKGEALPRSGVPPNQQFDNFYIDMNGLIHPCCHDTQPLPEPTCEEEMFSRIFNEIDLLVKIVQPRKALVLCVDGVAPRSKMNQQRSRRFRAAEERHAADAMAEECADLVVSEYGLPRPELRRKWDHNAITPYTRFMERMAKAVEWFIVRKLNTDEAWRHLTVVFSDAHVPGEGEHKIMEYIRNLRVQPGYDPETRHVIIGMDADLICLGLSTHERHVSILRNQLSETYTPVSNSFCYFDLEQYRGLLRQDFENLPSGFDFERVVDDFIFLCFFVGNDFLPHIPLISIRTKGIELMLDHYVRAFAQHGYLTDAGEVDYDHLAIFFENFIKRSLDKLKTEYKNYVARRPFTKKRVEERVRSIRETLTRTVKDRLPDGSDAHQVAAKALQCLTSEKRERANFVQDKQILSFSYASADFRLSYYRDKFGWDPARDRDEFERRVRECCRQYLRGVQWVMRYYTKGCPSWQWFYPYHYAPLLEDLAALRREDVDTAMTLGSPTHPVAQLLAVLPRDSSALLPKEFRAAVLDPKSPLGPFYTEKVDCDFTEASFAYEGVLLLPFYDGDDLRRAAQRVAPLPRDEGRTLIFCHDANPLAPQLEALLDAAERARPDAETENEEEEDAATDAANTAERVRAPISREIAQSFPLGGVVERLPKPLFPLNAPARCPDARFVKYCGDGDDTKPVAKNAVHVFSYELSTVVDYKQALLDAEVGERSPQPKRLRSNSPKDGDAATVKKKKKNSNSSKKGTTAVSPRKASERSVSPGSTTKKSKTNRKKKESKSTKREGTKGPKSKETTTTASATPNNSKKKANKKKKKNAEKQLTTEQSDTAETTTASSTSRNPKTPKQKKSRTNKNNTAASSSLSATAGAAAASKTKKRKDKEKQTKSITAAAKSPAYAKREKKKNTKKTSHKSGK